MIKLSGKIFLFIFLGVGFILRFFASIIHSYSSDELSAIHRLNFSSFSELIEIGVKTGDMHPAGVQIFLVFWSNLVGTNEILYRLPFVLLGTASIYLIYLLGKRINQQTGLFSAGIWSVLLFPILQSELARPYSPGLFFSLLVSLLILKLLFNQNTKRQLWLLSSGLGLSFAAAMYTHYFAFLFVGFIGMSSLVFIKKETLLPFITSGIIAILLFLPHLSITIYHTSVENGLQWLAPPTNGWIFDFLFFAFNSSWLIVSVSLLLAAIGFYRNKTISINKHIWVYLSWFFGIYIIAFLMSIYNTPILKFPVMLFPLPLLVMVLAYFINQTFQKRTILGLVICFGLIAMSSLFEKKLFSNTHFEVFKELADPALAWHDTYGHSNIINIMNVSNPDYFNYYPNRINRKIDLDINLLEYGDNEHLRLTLENSNKDFCIIGYSGRLTPPYFFKTALAFYPHIIDYKKLNNSAIFLLSKSSNETTNSLEENIISKFPANSQQWVYNKEKILFNSYRSDSTTIFGPEIKINVTENMVNNLEFITIDLDAKLMTETAQLTIAISAENQLGQPIYDLKNKPIYINQDLEQMLAKNHKAYFAFSVPKQLSVNDKLKIYLWNRNGQPVDVHNISIKSVVNIWN